MKNLLIATTALVATAGVAAAEINFSGGARFGATYKGSIAATPFKAGAVVSANDTERTRLDALSGAVPIGTLSVGATTDANIVSIKASIVKFVALQLTADTNVANKIAATGASTTALNTAATTAAANTKAANALLTAVSGTAAVAETKSKSSVHNRFTVNIDGTTETDSGIEFFARVRIRGGNTGDGATSASSVSAPRVGMKSGGITVAAGNINGALESTPGLYSGGVGLTGLGWGNLPINNNAAGAWAWTSFSSGGGGSNGVEVIYSADGFGAHVSVAGASGAQRTAMNVSYKFSDWTVALGHQSADVANEETTLLTVGGTIGDIAVGLAHADNAGDRDATRVNATFSVGAASKVSVFYTAASGVGREDAYGLGFSHSLGGATLAGGVANSFTGQTSADLGVRFNF